MKPFKTLKAVAAPLPLPNVDTDMIIPKQHLKTIKRTGLGKVLFDEMRFNADGTEKPDFVLNKPDYREAQILVTGENFGCGSSREHAPWALADFGIRCVISESFADIFFNNSAKNGILLIKLPKSEIALLMEDAKTGADFKIDLKKQTITRPNGAITKFEIDDYRKNALLKGLDDIAMTLEHAKEIDAFEEKRQSWL